MRPIVQIGWPEPVPSLRASGLEVHVSADDMATIDLPSSALDAEFLDLWDGAPPVGTRWRMHSKFIGYASTMYAIWTRGDDE